MSRSGRIRSCAVEGHGRSGTWGVETAMGEGVNGLARKDEHEQEGAVDCHSCHSVCL